MKEIQAPDRYRNLQKGRVKQSRLSIFPIENHPRAAIGIILWNSFWPFFTPEVHNAHIHLNSRLHHIIVVSVYLTKHYDLSGFMHRSVAKDCFVWYIV